MNKSERRRERVSFDFFSHFINDQCPIRENKREKNEREREKEKGKRDRLAFTSSNGNRSNTILV